MLSHVKSGPNPHTKSSIKSSLNSLFRCVFNMLHKYSTDEVSEKHSVGGLSAHSLASG